MTSQQVLFDSNQAIRTFDGEYRWLSNFYEEPVTVDGPWWTPGIACQFPTVEHAFQCAKVEPGEPHFSEHYEAIATADKPGKAKRLGQRKAFQEAGATLRGDWDQIKTLVMLRCLRCKFDHQTELADKLIATSPCVLIEGNSWGDDYWGVLDNGRGRGNNMLGRLLMLVRAELLVSRASGHWPQELGWWPRG